MRPSESIRRKHSALSPGRARPFWAEATSGPRKGTTRRHSRTKRMTDTTAILRWPRSEAKHFGLADRLLQLFRGFEARHPARDGHRLPRPRVAHRARLPARHPKGSEPHERHVLPA